VPIASIQRGRSRAASSKVQQLYFGDDFMLRRLDYVTDVLGGVAAHYCYDHVTIDGLIFPTLRRVVRRTPEGPLPSARTSFILDYTNLVVRMSWNTSPDSTRAGFRKLGIADVLSDGPKSCDEIAAVTRTPAASLSRLLRALRSLGVVGAVEGGKFELTSLGGPLQAKRPGSLRALVLTLGETHYEACRPSCTHETRKPKAGTC
jgi:hypothetical protein